MLGTIGPYDGTGILRHTPFSLLPSLLFPSWESARRRIQYLIMVIGQIDLSILS